MKEVIKLFKQIQETSSTNDKKTIIAANKDNELFKKCLVFLLDGNINTGLSEKKIKKKKSPEKIEEEIEDANCLAGLSINKFPKDPSIDEFYSLIEKAQKTAAQLGLTEEDINAEIKAMRADKRK